MRLPPRLVLDAIAAGLLLAGLAYYWVENAVHEWIGIGMFVLVALHNVFNRRWHAKVLQRRLDATTMLNTFTIGSLMVVMVVLLTSSVLVSRTAFAFLGLEGGSTARRVHLVAAHWAILILAIHLGTRWSLIMLTVRTHLHLAPSRMRTAVLRATAAAIALYGVQSSSTMVFGSKLFLIDVLDMWDFNSQATVFFLNFASIMGLYISLSHYVSLWLRRNADRSRKK
jgi:Domain of unknown function (DUF4405)